MSLHKITPQDMARGDRACAKERTFFRMISLDEGEIQAGAPAAGRCRQHRRDGNSSTPLPTRIMACVEPS